LRGTAIDATARPSSIKSACSRISPPGAFAQWFGSDATSTVASCRTAGSLPGRPVVIALRRRHSHARGYPTTVPCARTVAALYGRRATGCRRAPGWRPLRRVAALRAWRIASY